MIRIVITIATVLFSILASAQETSKPLQIDIRGRDCMGGSGICYSITSETVNKSTMKTYNIIKVTSKSMIIEVESSKLSLDDQKLLFGKELSRIAPNEELVFVQDQDYIFDIDTMIYLDMDTGFRMIKRGSYPLQIIKDKVQVTIELSAYR